MADAIPFISWGKWVADCPNPSCHNARQVRPGDASFPCDQPSTGCGQTSPIAWPDNIAQRMADLADRPESLQSETVPGSPQDVS